MNDKCNFCDATFYIKTVQCMRSLLAPTTQAEALRQQLEDLTGEIYVPVENYFCPVCGKRLKELQNGRDSG